MTSKKKPLAGARLTAHEAKRDAAAELLKSVRQMKAGKTRIVRTAGVANKQRSAGTA